MSEPLKPVQCPICASEMVEYSPGQELYTHSTKGRTYYDCPFRFIELRGKMIKRWNDRPGEDAARIRALEEGEQAVIAFIQSHYSDNYPDNEARAEERKCLEKDITNAYQVLLGAG